MKAKTKIEINTKVKPVITFDDYHEGEHFKEDLEKIGIKINITEIGLDDCGKYIFILHKEKYINQDYIQKILNEYNITLME